MNIGAQRALICGLFADQALPARGGGKAPVSAGKSSLRLADSSSVVKTHFGQVRNLFFEPLDTVFNLGDFVDLFSIH